MNNKPLFVIGNVDEFDYTRVSHYIYCYIDPTKHLNPTYELNIDLFNSINPKETTSIYQVDKSEWNLQNCDFDFIAQPFYIGRAVNFKGFRLYMHLSEYLRNVNITHDKSKYRRLDKIDAWLDENNLDWKWYKDNCIVVLSQIIGTSSVNHHLATEMLNYNEKVIIQQMTKDGIHLANAILYK